MKYGQYTDSVNELKEVWSKFKKKLFKQKTMQRIKKKKGLLFNIACILQVVVGLLFFVNPVTDFHIGFGVLLLTQGIINLKR